MWVKCRVCGENTYVSPDQEGTPAAYVCSACREAAKRRARASRERMLMIGAALALIVPMVYLISQGQMEALQFCWGGMVLLAAGFYFTWRNRSRA